jgi:hypothetical protein
MKDSSAPSKQRYRKLIETAHASGGLWIAESTDLVLILPNDCGEELILVWPTAEAAHKTIAARPDLSQFQPVHRTLDRWIGSSTPHLMEDGIFVAAYPDEQLNCLKVRASTFARDLSQTPQLQGKDISRLRRKLVKHGRHSGEV